MQVRKQLDISKVSNPYEKDILSFLNANGKCIYGEIIKELKISATKGQEAIYSLIHKGHIKQANKTSYIELNVELR
ncbi:hypothetical protein [Maribellus sp. YY47]|uniref:hypothetical protein n=1 Tax=Maribellus sp. YY47 TaxID=2929486 RepID=UPI0020006BA7|nr:hypothetical protein [Maribellus sp. YY47]MCK3684872.1 hypothetical protein [Maribellus sp. YY47]